MSRNIVNTEQLDRALRAACGDRVGPVVRSWVMRTARRWALKHLEPVADVLSFETHARLGPRPWIVVRLPDGMVRRYRWPVPAWLDAQLSNGATAESLGLQWLCLYANNGRLFLSELGEIVSFLESRDGEKLRRGLDRVSLPQARDATRQARRHALARNGEGGTSVLSFPDGFRIALLDSEAAFEREGRVMRHCAANYWRNTDPGSEILSLRSPEDKPCVTLEVAWGRDLVQVKGRGNNPVATRYRPYIHEFIHSLDLRVRSDHAWIGMTHRGFDPDDPRSWWHQPWLRQAIHHNGFDREFVYGRGFQRFRDDIYAVMDTLDAATFERLLDLFRAPDGRFAWLGRRRTHDVYGLGVAELELGFAWPLLDILEASDMPARRGLRRRIHDDIDDVVFEHCTAFGPRILDRKSVPHVIGLDLRRQRHARHSDLRHCIAQHRRAFRGLRRLNVAPETLARWESNRRQILDGLDASPRLYL